MYHTNKITREFSLGHFYNRPNIYLLLSFLILLITVPASASKSTKSTVVNTHSHTAFGLSIGPDQPQPNVPLPFCPNVLTQANMGPVRAETEASVNTPLLFIENEGQFDDDIRYQMWGGSWLMWMSDEVITVTLLAPLANASMPNLSSSPDGQSNQIKHQNIYLRFAGANQEARLEAFQPLDTKVSYFIGNDPNHWHADVPVWGGIRYVDLYPGVDLELFNANGRLHPRLVAHSEANLSAVRLEINGADSTQLSDNHLSIDTPLGSFVFPLFTVVSSNGENTNYIGNPLLHHNTITNPFAPSNGNRAVHDISQGPGNTTGINFATYLGALTYNGGRIAVGSDGSIYLGGMTYPAMNAPDDGICGVGQLSDAPCHQAFVSKLNAAGTQLEYFFWFGGDGIDAVEDIKVDASGSVYATGRTNSNNFYVKPGALSPTHGNGEWDGFVTKILPSGTDAVYSTYLPATVEEIGWSIAINTDGEAFVTGEFDAGSHTDAMVLKLNAAGNGLLYAIPLGGNNNDAGYSIAVDSNDSAYVTGRTYSSDYPTTPETLQTNYGSGDYDGFITKLTRDGNLIYSTFLPTNQTEAGLGIAIDEDNFAYITGPNNINSFVMKLSQNGQLSIYHRILSGNNPTQAYDIAVDGQGAVFLTGLTSADDFPTTSNAIQPTKPLHADYPEDSFIAKYDLSGNLVYATYLGGSERDYGTQIAVDRNGAVYATGFTNSSSVWEGGSFPTTSGAFRQLYAPGCQDPFVIKLAIDDGSHRLFLPLLVK